MKRSLVSAVAAAALAMAAAVGVTTAAGATLVSLVGDKDGLGLGLASGDGFDFHQVGPVDVQGTDQWHDGDFSFVHDYALAGPVASARLEVSSGGWGLRKPASLFLLDGTPVGTLVGYLTDSDDPLFLFRDVFDLTPFTALLSGNDRFEIRPAEGLGDAGALDYSQLSVTFGPAAAVPEPSGPALLGLALAALAASTRRRGTGR